MDNNNFFQETTPNAPESAPVKDRSSAMSVIKAILYVALFFVSQFAVTLPAAIVTSIVVAIKYPPEQVNEIYTQIISRYSNYISAASGILTLAILCVMFLVMSKKPLKEAYFFKAPAKKIALAAICGVCLNFACNVLMMFMPASWLADYEQASQGLDTGSLLSFIIGGVIVAPIVEEVVFRGLAMSRMKRATGASAAAVIVAVIFGICHGNLVWAIYAGSLGVILGFTFARYDSILPCIALHMGFNATSIYSYLLDFEKMSETQVYTANLVLTVISFVMVPISCLLVYLLLRKDVDYYMSMRIQGTIQQDENANNAQEGYQIL